MQTASIPTNWNHIGKPILVLIEMAKIGPGMAGGNNRQTLTDEDIEGRELFKQWRLDAGCSIGVARKIHAFFELHIEQGPI